MGRLVVGVMVMVMASCGGDGGDGGGGSQPDAGAASEGPPIKLKKVVAAGGFTCGLADAGGIWCWGSNYYGELGDGTTLSRSQPTQVGTATDWIDLSVRRNAGCGLRADHSLWCWGQGDLGQLGDGRQQTSYTPVQVLSDKPAVGWSTVSVGRGNACAIHTDGSAACWGLDRVTNTNRLTPVALDGNTDWTALSAGESSCGLRDGGHLYCWGYSSSGALGLGSVTSQAVPAQVGTNTWQSVALGYYNACGVRSDGALLCWGDNLQFATALHYGATPKQIGTATDWQSVALAVRSVIGLRAGGKAYGWGDNSSGELGLPSFDDVVEPTALGDVSWSQVSPGNSHSCGLVGDQASCWGAIGEGLLGDGVTTTRLTPTQLVDERWTAVTAGSGGVRGLRADGALMSSGYFSGLGSADPAWPPMRVGNDVWTGVFVGQDYVYVTCGLRGGAPSCWGDNSDGELGIGTTGDPVLAPAAVTVPPGSQWTELATGEHTCAIRSDGGLYCWGSNFSGQLGNDTAAGPLETPPAMPLAGTWRHVAITGSTTCAIQTDHTLWCWGNDSPTDQQTMTHDVPTKIGTDADWNTVALASAAPSGIELCAIKTDGSLWCWGTVPGGKMVMAPAQVGTDHWQSIALGGERCGIKTDGSLWCWDNVDILGDGSPLTTDMSGVVVPVLAPTRIGSDTDWATVATGGPTCGTKVDGHVLCWGLGAASRADYSTTPVVVRLPAP